MILKENLNKLIKFFINCLLIKKYKNFSFLFLLIIFLTFFPKIIFADVSKIVFITEEQVIGKNEISNAITIQTQDSSGNLIQTNETIDIEFTSTSKTGEFLNSSGNSATKYMSTNTANKTFYYRDNSVGNFTININAIGRNSLKEFTASQSIKVLDSNSSNNKTNNSVSENISQKSEDSSTSISSNNPQIEVSIGENRLTSVGSEIIFSSVVKKNSTNSKLDFNWSFGDGNVAVGQIVKHKYKYSGDYVVVLKTEYLNNFVSNRIKVKVVDPKIEIVDEKDFINIFNNGDLEINLFQWKLEAFGKSFIFQPDTIILPKNNLKVDKSLLTMKDGVDDGLIYLKNSFWQIISSNKGYINNQKIETNSINLNNNQNLYKQKNVDINNQKENISYVNKNESNPYLDIKKDISNIDKSTTSGAFIYQSNPSQNFIHRLTNFVKRVLFK